MSHPASSMSAPDLRPDPASTGKTNAMSPSDGGLPSQTPTQTRTTIDPLSHVRHHVRVWLRSYSVALDA